MAGVAWVEDRDDRAADAAAEAGHSHSAATDGAACHSAATEAAAAAATETAATAKAAGVGRLRGKHRHRKRSCRSESEDRFA